VRIVVTCPAVADGNSIMSMRVGLAVDPVPMPETATMVR
jgi:hypothetical protein